ncbi:MAG: UdgX family uracil-DNA binding protein [Thermoanaerobaculia bacterium]
MKRVRIEPQFDSWREAARALLSEGVDHRDVVFDAGESPLLPGMLVEWRPGASRPLSLPRRFVNIARLVAAHRDPERWSLLYRGAWRLLHQSRSLLEMTVDDDVLLLKAREHDVRRDIHKMHAFVRFQKSDDDHFVAFYRPDHAIVPLASPFFRDRFPSMRWSILTPDLSAQWDGTLLTYTAGADFPPSASADQLEALWRTYYRSIFNPARINLTAMKNEMPSRFWKGMPETRDLSRLVQTAAARVSGMSGDAVPSAAPFVPRHASLAEQREAAASCDGCALRAPATQVVYGEGPADARVVMVGEQPGDVEDRSGRPFTGPAGEVFDRALAEAGIDRQSLYVTNAVKHFAYIERGKHRIHRTPKTIEVTACRPWLHAELDAIRPKLIVTLGATAARSLLGAQFRLMQERGRMTADRSGRAIFPTIHPSAVLRAGDEGPAYFAMLVADLRAVAQLMRSDGLGASAGTLFG